MIIIKQLSAILLSAASLYAVTFEFGAGLTGNYDSNLGQNYHEKSGTYLVPELSAEVSFPKVSLFAELVYDFHVAERDFDDNTPFLNIGTEGKFEREKFHYNPSFIYELYLANDVYRSYGAESENWVSVIQEYFLLNDFSLRTKRKAAGVLLGVSYQDWADGDGEQSGYLPEKEGIYLTAEPYVKRSWKVKNDDRIKITSVSGKFKYEEALLDDAVDSYSSFKGTVKSSLKLFHPELSLGVSYGKKIYRGENDHPVSGIYEIQWKRYFEIAPAIEVLLPLGLAFEFEIDHDMKFSNFPDDEFNRTVFSLGLRWDGKIKTEKRD